MAVVLVCVRAYDSAKGLLPVVLLAPVLTPFGDLASLDVAIWHADALLLSVADGAVVATAARSAATAEVRQDVPAQFRSTLSGTDR